MRDILKFFPALKLIHKNQARSQISIVIVSPKGGDHQYTTALPVSESPDGVNCTVHMLQMCIIDFCLGPS